MLKFKFKKLGIKRKVLVGCIVLAVILFFSSVISVLKDTSTPESLFLSAVSLFSSV